MAKVMNAAETMELIKKGGTVMVDFYADWCGPCKMLAPILEQVSEEIGDAAQIVKVNTEENQDFSMSMGVSSIPTLVLFKDGKEVERKVGFVPKPALVQWVK